MGECLDRILAERGLPPIPNGPICPAEPAPSQDETGPKPVGEAVPPAARGFVRRTGGQPFNQNARKHGLYSKYLAPRQRQDYNDARGVRGVEAELALFRCKLAEMLETEPWNWTLLNRITNTILRLEAALPPEPQENKVQLKVLNIWSQLFDHSLAAGDEYIVRMFNEWMAKHHGDELVSENESCVQPEAESG